MTTTLYITRIAPLPAHTGALIYTMHALRVFSKLSSRLIVIAAEQADHQSDPSALSSALGREVLIDLSLERKFSAARYLLSREPKAASEARAAANLRLLRDYLASERPEIVVLDHIASSWGLDVVQAYRSANPRTKLVYLTHNEEIATRRAIAQNAKLPGSLAHYFDVGRVRARTSQLMNGCDLVTTCCEADLLSDRALYPLVPLIEIPTIHTGGRLPTRDFVTAPPARNITLLGSFLWSAKALSARKFLAACGDSLSRRDIAINVVGRMSRTFKEALIREFPWANIVGEVEEVGPYLADTRAGLLIDDVGGAFKQSILTLAFHRVPLIGLKRAVHDTSLYSAGIFVDTLAEVVDAIVRNIDNLALLNRLQARAYEYCERHHGGEHILDRSVSEIRERLYPVA